MMASETSNGDVSTADDTLSNGHVTKRSRRSSSPPSYGTINRSWTEITDDHPFYHSDEALLKKKSGNESTCCGFVPIEIPVLLYFMAMYTTNPLTTFYLNDRLYEEYGLPNTTAGCSANESETGLMNTIQKKLTDYNMYLNFLVNFPGFLPALFMGSVSDRFGRKIAIYMVSIATLIKNGVYALVFHYHWRIEYMYIGNVVEGLTGSFGTFLMGTYGIVADHTSATSARGFKITCVQAAIAIGQSAGTTATGYWIEASGYMQPILFAAGVQVFNVLFVFFFLPNTMPARVSAPLSCSAVLESVHVFLRPSAGKRRAILLITLVTFGLGMYNIVALLSVLLLYLLNYPFCWSDTHITFFSGICTLASWTVVLSTIGLFGRVVRDDVFALMGCLISIAYYLVQGLATTTNMIYIAGACGVFSNLAMPMLRTIMSKEVEAHEQGSLFAGIGVVEMLMTTISSVSANAIYQASLGVLRGLIFYCLAGISGLSTLLLLVVVILRNSEPKTRTIMEIEGSEPNEEREPLTGESKHCQDSTQEG